MGIFTSNNNNNYFSSYIDIKAISTPSNPNSGIGRIFHRSSDNKLCFKLSNGTVIDMTSGGSPTFAGLTDVNLSSLANGDIPRYNSSTSDWENGKITNDNIDAAAAIATTKLADSANFALTTRTNTFGAFDQIIPTGNFKLSQGSFKGTFVVATLASDRTWTMPDATGTIQTQSNNSTLSNKSISGLSNTITNIGDSAIASHTSTKITITAKGQLNSQIAYKDDTAWLTNAMVSSVDWAKLTSVPATFAPAAHKGAHVFGGGDAFVKGDRIFAAAIYLENRTDVSADKARFWLESGGDDIRYWSDDATSVKHSVATDLNTLTLVNKSLTAAKVTNYIDFDKQASAPSDPDSTRGFLYLREIDADNNGIFVKHKQGGIMLEEQISPLPLVETYLNDLEDVSWVTPLPNQRPVWDGTNLVNSPPPPSENPEIKSGEWYPGSTADIATGMLSVDIGTEVGTVTRSADSKGRYTQFETSGATINVGVYQTVARYRREYESKIYAYWLGTSGSSNTQYYIGFTESATLPAGDAPLDSGVEGVLVALLSADNGSPPGTLKVLHNDGVDATNVTDTGVPYGGSSTYHKVEVHLSSTNVKVYVDNALTNTLTTEIPSVATPLYPYVLVRKPGGGEKNIKVYKVGVISK